MPEKSSARRLSRANHGKEGTANMKGIFRIIMIGLIFLVPGIGFSEQILDITIEPVQGPGAEESVTIRYTVRNNSDHEVSLLKWGTPFEGFKTDLFKITRASTTDAPYIGRRVSRLSPGKEDYVAIPAKSAIYIDLPLEAGYDLRMDGNHTAVLRNKHVKGEILDSRPDSTKAVTRSASLMPPTSHVPAATAPPEDLPVVKPNLPGAAREYLVEAPSPPVKQSLSIRTLQPADARVSQDKIEFTRKAPQTLSPDQLRKFQVPRIQKIRNDRSLPLLPRTVSADVLVQPAVYDQTPSYAMQEQSAQEAEKQAAVTKAFRNAQRMAAEAKVILEGPDEIVQTSDRFKLWFGSPDNLRQARNTFGQIFKHFFKKIYFYAGEDCAKSDAAYVNANGKIAYSYIRRYDPEGNDIFLCPSFWGIPADGQEVSKSGVIFHEMSHLADDTVVDIPNGYGKCSVAAEKTDDCATQGIATASDRIQVEDTVHNADNYHLFAANLERLVSIVRSILDPDKGTRYLVQLRNSLGQYVQADPNSGAVRENARAAPYTFIISDTKGDNALKDGDQIRLYTSNKKLCTPGFFTIHKVERQSGEAIGQGDYVFLKTLKLEVLTIEKQKNFRIDFAQ
jgi:hypothetical protein